MERGLLQFEQSLPLGASLDDLDQIQVEAYARAYLSALKIEPGDPAPDPNEILLQRGCLKVVDGEPRPTYAALLLFGRNPQRWLPSATILAVRFPGLAFGDQYIKQDIRGSLPQQLKEAEVFLRNNLQNVVRISGLVHQETPEYPFEAVRELLVNAVAHRDYNLQGDTIHLNIFADRLEVTSPGVLPGPVNLKNLLEARFSRNAVLVQILSDLGFVERLGYGLDRVVRLMQQHDLRPPSFAESAGSFKVILYNAAQGETGLRDLSRYRRLELNPRQETAINFLGSHRRLASSDFQALCPEVHPETLRRDLADLVGRGVLIKVGDKKATYYILK
jgi:ATP-dependent DNA helicase RecG